MGGYPPNTQQYSQYNSSYSNGMFVSSSAAPGDYTGQDKAYPSKVDIFTLILKIWPVQNKGEVLYNKTACAHFAKHGKYGKILFFSS